MFGSSISTSKFHHFKNYFELSALFQMFHSYLQHKTFANVVVPTTLIHVAINTNEWVSQLSGCDLSKKLQSSFALSIMCNTPKLWDWTHNHKPGQSPLRTGWVAQLKREVRWPHVTRSVSGSRETPTRRFNLNRFKRWVKKSCGLPKTIVINWCCKRGVHTIHPVAISFHLRSSTSFHLFFFYFLISLEPAELTVLWRRPSDLPDTSLLSPNANSWTSYHKSLKISLWSLPAAKQKWERADVLKSQPGSFSFVLTY